MEVLDQLRAAGLTLTASGDTLLVEPRSVLTDELRELIRANKPVILGALATESKATHDADGADEGADRYYARGLTLLAELLSRESFIPEPTVASLQRYFPPLCGVQPPWLSDEDWEDRLEYYRDLVVQFGYAGTAPPKLLKAVRRWEDKECGRAQDGKPMPVPLAPWRQKASAEWKRIRDASRKGGPMPPPALPPAVRSTPAPSSTPPSGQTTSVIEERQKKVEEHLRSHPELQRAFDVVNAPLRPEPGEPVSVVRAVRQDDQIVSGEIMIPRETFELAQFLQTVDPAEKPQ